jgi:hypothetical protein
LRQNQWKKGAIGSAIPWAYMALDYLPTASRVCRNIPATVFEIPLNDDAETSRPVRFAGRRYRPPLRVALDNVRLVLRDERGRSVLALSTFMLAMCVILMVYAWEDNSQSV